MATKANLSIDQGADFTTTITLSEDGVGADLTGYTGAGQIRKYYTSSTSVDFEVTTSVQDSTVTLQLTSNTTNSMVAGRYVYDVELTNDSGIVSRVMEGIVTVNPGVTR